MTDLKDRILHTARLEAGYLEKRSDRDLESKTANAGNANYSKYGAWYGQNPDSWCAMFVSWCFAEAFGEDIAKKLLCGDFSSECEALRRQFARANRYHLQPREGDLIFFRGIRHAGANHIGLVSRVGEGCVRTIEGNTVCISDETGSIDGVAEKTYRDTDRSVMGYGRPPYELF